MFKQDGGKAARPRMMTDVDDPVHQAFSSALLRASKQFKNKDVAKYVEAAVYMLHQQVCPHCVLRLLGDTVYEHYSLPLPPVKQLIQCLAARQQQQPAASTAAGSQPADTGIGPAPATSNPLKRPHENHDQQPEPEGTPADTSQPPVQNFTSHAAKRLHLQAGEQQATAATPPPLPLVDIVQAQQPCPMCLGILQLLHSSVTTTAQACPTTRQTANDMPPGSQIDTLRNQPASGLGSSMSQPQLKLADIEAAVAASELEYKAFGVEVQSPLTVVCREGALQAHLIDKFGAKGVFSPWQASNIVPLKNVARRMLSGPLSKALGRPYTEAHAADITVCITFEHAASKPELIVLAEDCLRMKQRREQPKQPKQPKQQNKKQQQQVATTTATTEHTSITNTLATADEISAAVTVSAPVPTVSAAANLDIATTGTGAANDGKSGQAGQAMRSTPELQITLDSLDWERASSHLANMPIRVLTRLLPWPPVAHLGGPAAIPTVSVHRPPLMLAGRYLKLRRNMPQTQWCDPRTGLRIGGVSLAEHIAEQLLELYGAKTTKFISGGREDADVRMLGEGRPFVIEVSQAQRDHPPEHDLRAVEERLREQGSGAQVRYLRPCTKQAVDKIKEAEETKEKTYQALCWCSQALSESHIARLRAVQQLVVNQDTPVRVLHRRAPKVRGKHVSVEDVTVLEGRPHYFTLKLRTQAGTYIKEFCHGDFGRTCPSVADLLAGPGEPPVRVEILQLDVLAVHMDDWP